MPPSCSHIYLRLPRSRLARYLFSVHKTGAANMPKEDAKHVGGGTGGAGIRQDGNQVLASGPLTRQSISSASQETLRTIVRKVMAKRKRQGSRNEEVRKVSKAGTYS